MDGIVNLLKPPGMTSHDCVDVVRRLLRTRRVGHTGTLDPGAAGVLVLCVGAATRLSEFLMEADKAYRVDLVLGVATATGDAFGEVIGTGEAVAERAQVEEVLSGFVGTQQQVPPMVSAVHHQGKRLYELARKGIEVEREAREITVREIRIIRFAPPSVLFDIVCSKGTYVRQLCHDAGERLGCGAHAGFMVRTRAGPYALADSVTFEEIEAALGAGAPGRVLVSAAHALPEVPDVEVAGPLRAAVLQGQALPLWKVAPHLALPPRALVKVLDEDGRLLALGRVEAGKLRPFKVMR
jgi:tRNA pseudouridine55 synthase